MAVQYAVVELKWFLARSGYTLDLHDVRGYPFEAVAQSYDDVIDVYFRIDSALSALAEDEAAWDSM